MKKTVSKSDVVALMRTIRDQFSREIQNMSLEEEKAYMKKILFEQKQKRKEL